MHLMITYAFRLSGLGTTHLIHTKMMPQRHLPLGAGFIIRRRSFWLFTLYQFSCVSEVKNEETQVLSGRFSIANQRATREITQRSSFFVIVVLYKKPSVFLFFYSGCNIIAVSPNNTMVSSPGQ